MIQIQSAGVIECRTHRLDYKETRNLIEELKRVPPHREYEGSCEFSVIVIDFRTSDHRSTSQTLAEIDRLDRLMAADWAHAKFLGWIGPDRMAVILPNATAMDAWQYKNQIAERCDVPADRVSVFARQHERIAVEPGQSYQVVPSVDDLFVRRIPTWKRLMDIAGASIGLFATMPLIMLSALIIRLTSRGPVLFRQWRVGIGGRPFLMYKLRTMVHGAETIRGDLDDHNESDGCAFKMKSDPRVTLFGRFLRKSSIDEFPQLINVLRGEMSLVGPRPLPCEDWAPPELWYRGRHDVTPGITCFWQVSGRGDPSCSFQEWVDMDIEYVEKQSFWTDVKLVAMTIPAVIAQRGAV